MPGSVDPNGVYIYAEDDIVSPFSDYMNLGQESVSESIADHYASLSSRLTDLEADRTSWTGTTFASGFTGTVSAWRDGLTVTINATMSGTLAFTATGLISVINANVIPAAFRPNGTPDNRWGAAYLSGGTAGHGLAVIDNTGLVRLFKGAATSNTGAQFTLTYNLAP